MSTDQNAISDNSLPRRTFLKKGEGLKRFAAYKPPPPTTIKKSERRQTFVKFKVQDDLPLKREPKYPLPLEILNDESINLSTEIPKIAPPKIMHTPIRPNRQALGMLSNGNSLYTDCHIEGNIDTLLKKIEEKKTTLSESEPTILPHNALFDNVEANKWVGKKEPKRQPRGNRKKPPTPEPMVSYESPEGKVIFKTPKQKRSTRSSAEVSAPMVPACYIIELGNQIEQIEATVNELKEKIKMCECGVFAPGAPKPSRKRPTTRAAAKAAKTKASDTDRPSANADKSSSSPIELNPLFEQVSKLRAKFDEMNLQS